MTISIGDEKTQRAMAEVQARITVAYPDATFHVAYGDDPLASTSTGIRRPGWVCGLRPGERSAGRPQCGRRAADVCGPAPQGGTVQGNRLFPRLPASQMCALTTGIYTSSAWTKEWVAKVR
jgi:hypothetical protein